MHAEQGSPPPNLSDDKGVSSSAEDVLVAAEALAAFTQSQPLRARETVNQEDRLPLSPQLSRVNGKERNTAGSMARTNSVRIPLKDKILNRIIIHTSAGDLKSKQACHYLSKAFPRKLLEMLSREDVAHAIAWLPDGKTFVIVNAKKLTDDVLPRFFKQTKFDSFVRKLNRWGFRRLKKHGGAMMFSHDTLHRGSLDLPNLRTSLHGALETTSSPHSTEANTTSAVCQSATKDEPDDGSFSSRPSDACLYATNGPTGNSVVADGLQENATAMHLLDILVLSKLAQMPATYTCQLLKLAEQNSVGKEQGSSTLRISQLINSWEELFHSQKLQAQTGAESEVVRAAIDVLRHG